MLGSGLVFFVLSSSFLFYFILFLFAESVDLFPRAETGLWMLLAASLPLLPLLSV